jgi:hypothetical protein
LLLVSKLADEQHCENTCPQAVERTFMQKMLVGLFDPPEGNPWAKLGLDDMNSSHSQQVAHEAALQSFVLLKNDKGTLPLKLGSNVAVVGTLATTASLYNSDYAVAGMPPNSPSIADAVTALNHKHGGVTVSATGVTQIGADYDISGAMDSLAMVAAADATVLVLGITKQDEHEGIDRANTLLPAAQETYAKQVFAAAAGKPVVLVLISGGILSIDDLVTPAPAIVDAFNPAQAGPVALAQTLFGLENRWGKLPVTIYPGSYSSQLKIQDMAFTTSPGRGYRYYSGTPLFEFGSGLSLTTFTHSCACDKLGPTDIYISCKCNVKNTGPMVGDEVVMVFDALSAPIRASIGSSHPVPIKRLVGFERTRVPPGGSATVDFNIPKVSLSLVTADGSKKLYLGVACATVWLLSVAIFGLRTIR